MPVSEVRYQLAQVTEESRDGWRSFTKRHGSNPTALAEVMGLYLGAMSGPADRLPAWLERLVEQAVALEDERRQRRT